jgi:hypothetical protein
MTKFATALAAQSARHINLATSILMFANGAQSCLNPPATLRSHVLPVIADKLHQCHLLFDLSCTWTSSRDCLCLIAMQQKQSKLLGDTINRNQQIAVRCRNKTSILSTNVLLTAETNAICDLSDEK